METYYQSYKATPDCVTPDSYYALLDGSWHRIKCLEINRSKAKVFFIDRGEIDIVPIERLCDLRNKFTTLPAQAMQISLKNLDSLEVKHMFLKTHNNVIIDVFITIMDQLFKTVLNPNVYIQKVRKKFFKYECIILQNLTLFSE